jgi:hypothetical protein
MKTMSRLKSVLAVILLGSLVIGGSFIVAAPATPRKEAKKKEVSPGLTIPLKLGSSIPLDVQSAGVEWRRGTYRLVTLGSIQFELDKQTSRLTAEVTAEVTMFDNVDYDVSVAVFDGSGRLLGVARARCGVQRVFISKVMRRAQTIGMDFGVSLDYAKAATFMVSISNRKVLTPDEWQKK